MKVFENQVCAIWVNFEWGEPYFFELIDKQDGKTLCKDFIRNRGRLYRYEFIRDIAVELEKWLEKRNPSSEEGKSRKSFFLPPPNLPPI